MHDLMKKQLKHADSYKLIIIAILPNITIYRRCNKEQVILYFDKG